MLKIQWICTNAALGRHPVSLSGGVVEAQGAARGRWRPGVGIDEIRLQYSRKTNVPSRSAGSSIALLSAALPRPAGAARLLHRDT
ncbi:hypothetical protein WJX72_007985 [[Myrmecia] bisecta]|uniref:Uncharacterized protein n=1 Tax=[Myrmecia] bisecta TaxID=41462 RepID=A0AAW1Q5N8_9CHLO